MVVGLSPNYILITLILEINNKEGVLVTISIYTLDYFNKNLINL